MTILTRFSTDGMRLAVTEDRESITTYLHDRGIRFEAWKCDGEVEGDDSSETVLKMYATEVQKLKEDSGFQSADVIQLHPNHEMREELRGNSWMSMFIRMMRFVSLSMAADFFTCTLKRRLSRSCASVVISLASRLKPSIGLIWGQGRPLPVSGSLPHQMAGLLILPAATSLNGSHDLRTTHRETTDMDSYGYRRYHDQYLLCS